MYYGDDDDLLTFLAKLRSSDPSPLDRSLIAGVKEGIEEPAPEITKSDKDPAPRKELLP